MCLGSWLPGGEAGGVEVQVSHGCIGKSQEIKKPSSFLLYFSLISSLNKYLYVTYTFSRLHNFNMSDYFYLLLHTISTSTNLKRRSLFNNFSTLLANILSGFIHELLIYQIMPFRVTFIRFLSNQRRVQNQEHKNPDQESLGNQPVDYFYFRRYRQCYVRSLCLQKIFCKCP